MWQLWILQGGPREDGLPDEVDQKAGPARLRISICEKKSTPKRSGTAECGALGIKTFRPVFVDRILT